MKLNIYTVFDNKAQAYLQPFFMANDQTAIRSFGDAVNDTSHSFYKHPEDYSLFNLGVYDDANGVIQSENPLHIVTGLQVKV